MSFRLVPKSVTLNDLERRNGRYIALFGGAENAGPENAGPENAGPENDKPSRNAASLCN